MWKVFLTKENLGRVSTVLIGIPVRLLASKFSAFRQKLGHLRPDDGSSPRASPRQAARQRNS